MWPRDTNTDQDGDVPSFKQVKDLLLQQIEVDQSEKNAFLIEKEAMELLRMNMKAKGDTMKKRHGANETLLNLLMGQFQMDGTQFSQSTFALQMYQDRDIRYHIRKERMWATCIGLDPGPYSPYHSQSRKVKYHWDRIACLKPFIDLLDHETLNSYQARFSVWPTVFAEHNGSSNVEETTRRSYGVSQVYTISGWIYFTWCPNAFESERPPRDDGDIAEKDWLEFKKFLQGMAWMVGDEEEFPVHKVPKIM